MSTVTIDNNQDVLDSRDIIERIEEIEEAQTEEGQLPDSEAEELVALQSLAEDGKQSPGWVYGETLIRESFFEAYAMELADDIGAINKDATWPLTCIDWTEAAEQLKQYYYEVDFDGVAYFIRA